MTIEILNTGSELLLGRTLNTHQQWLGRRLADLGFTVSRQTTVADAGPAIADALREGLARADLILTTGGLGPTSDDLTREHVAALLGLRLVEDPAIRAHIDAFFAARNRAAPARTQVQALVPEGARVLPNPHGTAPGLAIRVAQNSPLRPPASRDPAWIVMLPGPPRELRPMFDEQVVPLLRDQWPGVGDYLSRTLKTTGLGESFVEEKLAQPLALLLARGLELGYCARVGEVEVRVAARGAGAPALIREAEEAVRKILGDLVYAQDDQDIESLLIRTLTERSQTLAIAESCTGGLLGHRLTNVPGASRVFLAGWITYSNAAKTNCLGVPEQTLLECGAVSAETARAMAEGARLAARSDYALAVTGIAGPGGGTDVKPVGTAFIAIASSARTLALRVFNPWDRETFKLATSNQALDLLRKEISGLAPSSAAPPSPSNAAPVGSKNDPANPT